MQLSPNNLNESNLNVAYHSPLQGFCSGELVNEFEMTVMDIAEMCLGADFRYLAEYPLEKICQRPESTWLNKEDWQFLVNSRVDITVMEKTFGSDRRAKLVMECQSRWHDNLVAKRRDDRKAQLLASVKVPLIYVRRIDQDHRFIRFYTPDEQQEVLFDLVTQQKRQELTVFLRQCQTRLC